jgi:hypothetical protein
LIARIRLPENMAHKAARMRATAARIVVQTGLRASTEIVTITGSAASTGIATTIDWFATAMITDSAGSVIVMITGWAAFEIATRTGLAQTAATMTA